MRCPAEEKLQQPSDVIATGPQLIQSLPAVLLSRLPYDRRTQRGRRTLWRPSDAVAMASEGLGEAATRLFDVAFMLRFAAIR